MSDPERKRGLDILAAQVTHCAAEKVPLAALRERLADHPVDAQPRIDRRRRQLPPAVVRDQNDVGVELRAEAAAEHVARPHGAEPADIDAAGRDSVRDHVRARRVVGVEGAGACCQDEQDDGEADGNDALFH